MPTRLRHILAVLLALATVAAGQDLGLPKLPGLTPAAKPAAALTSADRARVSAKADFAKAEPGQQLVVAVVLDIDAGFHAQSSKPRQDFLIPFRLVDLVAQPGEAFAPIYPEGHVENYPALAGPGTDGNVSVYTSRAVTYVPVQVPADAEAGSTLSVSGGATFQICDENECLAPTFQPVPWRVEVPIVAPRRRGHDRRAGPVRGLRRAESLGQPQTRRRERPGRAGQHRLAFRLRAGPDRRRPSPDPAAGVPDRHHL